LAQNTTDNIEKAEMIFLLQLGGGKAKEEMSARFNVEKSGAELIQRYGEKGKKYMMKYRR